jgi:thiamine biosynthesis protein ThiI
VLLLVRYGEIAIKSPKVRERFESRLAENVKTMLARDRVECLVRRDRGRLFVSAGDDARSRSGATSALRRTFGVVSFSEVRECVSSLEEIKALAVEMASRWDSCTFAVRPRRSGTHKYTSRDVAVAVGRAIQDSAGARALEVDLGKPKRELYVEVRDTRAFLFEEVIEGPGGLPVGTQGKVGIDLKGEEDAAAAWLVLKRGCALVACGREELARSLERWAPSVKRVPAGEGREVERLLRRGAEAIATGEREPRERPPAGAPRTLLLQPLVGLSDAEIEGMLRTLKEPP